MEGLTKAERTAIALALGLAIWYVLVAIDSAGIAEMGDGVQHHLIARFALVHPRLLLDHWGKPLFTLLSTPFAQFGMDAMAVFNALLAAVTAWVAIKALRPAGGFAQLAFPMLVMIAPLYRYLAVGGMTEILFGLMTVLTVVLLMWDRPVLAAIVASFTPFSRPEFVAFVPTIALWLSLQRNWRSLPFLATGMVLYSITAWIALGDPLWYWNKDPYPSSGAVYGSGDPWIFLDNMQDIAGRPLKYLFALALVLWPFAWRVDREQRERHILLLITAALPALLIVALHSWLWAYGLKGSAGLLRVIVTTIPMAGLFTVFTIARAGKVLMKERTLRMDMGWMAFAGVALWSWNDLQAHRLFPVRANPDQVILDQAGEVVRHYAQQGRKIYSTHPYIGLNSGVDPFDPDRFQMLWGTSDLDRRFDEGDLIFWDAQLGPNENGVPLGALLDDPHFTVLGFWAPSTGHVVLGGYNYELFLFERRDTRREIHVDTLATMDRVSAELQMRADTIPCPDGSGAWCFGESEFPVEIYVPFPGPEVLFDELWVTASIERGGGEKHHIDMAYGQKLGGPHVRYDAQQLKDGPFTFHARAGQPGPGVRQVLYLYNVSRQPFRVRDFRLVRRRWIQHAAAIGG